MAGDWIKMRSDLFTHPKVVRISSALKADRLRTVGGLMSVWCLFDAHSIDGKLDGYNESTLDDLIGWPGFTAAMIAVDWMEVNGETVVLPRFDTHNGASAKRRAQDADRKRSVRNVSASDADKKRTREEKNREEKKEQKKKQPPGEPVSIAKSELPSWIDLEAWAGFAAMRRKERHPLTDRAICLIVKKLEALRVEGSDPTAVLDQSTRNGWRDVFELKQKPGNSAGGSVPDYLVGAR
jgi:hypothetical protein